MWGGTFHPIANRLIAGAMERYTKTLWSDRGSGQRPILVRCRDEAQQDEYLIDRVLKHYEEGIPLRRQAVLFRAAHLSDSLEIERARRNIPFQKYGGLRFLEVAYVKDLLAGRIVEHVTEHRFDPRAIRAGRPMRNKDWLVLSTIHSAKGGEWDRVYLTHAVDGFLPFDLSTGSQEEIEEELRLTYVALTRAKRFLYVAWPLRYYHKWRPFTDDHTYARVCRFFADEVLASLEPFVLARPDDFGPESPLGMRAEVRDEIRRLWDT